MGFYQATDLEDRFARWPLTWRCPRSMLHQLGRDALGLSDHFELLGELGLIDDLAFFTAPP